MSLSLLENLRRDHGKSLGDTFDSDGFKTALNVAILELVSEEHSKLSSANKREASAAANRIAGARDLAARLHRIFTPPEPFLRKLTGNLNHST